MTSHEIDKHQQLFRHDPANGVYGDCFRTVIACLLNRHPESVPHFGDGPDDGKAGERVNAFLAPLGLKLIAMPLLCAPRLLDALQTGARYSEGMHWLLVGESRNGSNHVVICHGARIVHDTSIDRSGIVGPANGETFWIAWLVSPGVPADRKEAA